MNDKIQYWLDIADYDLETAKAMLETKRYLYVGFMCHQVIEKGLKAYYVFSRDEVPPYTHNLTYLAELSELIEYLSEDQKNFIDQLQPLNIEARYPSYKDEILKTLTPDRCHQLLNNTEEFYKWIKEKRLKK